MVTERDAARYVQRALEAERADDRRDAITQVRRTRFANHETVVRACYLIARSDPSAGVRTVAVRAVAESMAAEAAQTLLEILNPERGDGGDGRVSVEALRGLYFLRRNDAVDETLYPTIVSTASRRVTEDPSRDVRIAAARVLGAYAKSEALNALIQALDDDDFGVEYHAERSLTRLTGVEHNHDARAWRRWFAMTDAPFARRGRLDATLEPAVRLNWWQRVSASVRRSIAGFGSKQGDVE